MLRPELEARAAALALAAFHLCNVVRKLPGGQNPADQLADSASSASSNYRATSRSRSKKEFAAKIGVVAEEADEAVGWLEHMAAAKLGDPATVNSLLDEARQLRNIFAASYKTSSQGKRRGPKGR
jgi:four helix bundle protein